MRVLVTGGAGYIGSVVAEALCGRGDDVVVYDDLSTGHRDAVPIEAAFAQGDVLDTARLARALLVHRVEAVIHLAAATLVAESMRDPARYYRQNVEAGLSLLEAMRRAEVEVLVCSSTAAVYGEAGAQPIAETTPARPTNPYGATKLAFEQALGWWRAVYGLRATALRYFNAAGATARCGERHDPETHLVPLALQVAAGQLPELIVNGADHATRDGTCVRDYVHVVDLADAHARALDALADGAPGGAYNLGCGGQGFTVREVIATAERVTGRRIPTRTGPRRPGDPTVLLAATDLARRELGWTPRAGLAEMVGSAWRWMETHGRVREPCTAGAEGER